MNKEQLQFINSDIVDCKLIGIPGGGKTTTIIHKILHHMELKEIDKTNFLIITFSKKACCDFMEKGDSVKKNIFSRNNVKTIHSLAGSLANSKTSSLDIVIASSLDIIKNSTKQELLNNKCICNIKLLIIDEAQDISGVQYNFIKTIADKLMAKLILVGDPNQNIYQFQNGSDKYIMEHTGKEFFLINNHRSTKKIVDLINHFRPYKSQIPDMLSKTNILSDTKPILFIGNMNEIKEYIMNDIKTTKYKMHEIAIIGPVKKSKQQKDNTYANIGLQYFVNLFDDNGTKYVKHYNETTDNQEIVSENQEITEGSVNLLTIHGSKGLEFKKVILLNFHLSTCGKMPSQEEYNRFRYLWYVALSRSKEELTIVADSSKKIMQIENMNLNLFNCINAKPYITDIIFNKKLKSPSSITELLKTKEIFTEEILLDISTNLNFSCNKVKMYDTTINADTYELFNKYSSLYGIYIEHVYEYFYSIKNNIEMPFIETSLKIFQNDIILEAKEANTVAKLLDKINKKKLTVVTLKDFEAHKQKFTAKEKELYQYIANKYDYNLNKEFCMIIDNSNVYINNSEMVQLCEKIKKDYTNPDNLYNIFVICLYYYQMEHEAKYLYKAKKEIYLTISKSLNNTINEIKKMEFTGKYNFQVPVVHKYLDNLNGVIDIHDTTNNKLIEIKFVKNVSIIHQLQIFLYNSIINPTLKNKYTMEIWNFYDGTKYEIKYNSKITNFEFIMKLADILDKKIKNLYIVYDLETTGLIQSETKYPEILQRHFYEMNLCTVIDTGLVKPKIPVDSIDQFIIDLTKLKREDINKAESFDNFKDKMCEIISKCESPKFIAHNGNRFDHKIMRHYDIFTHDCVCIDSLTIIYNIAQVKGRLSEIYTKITGKVSPCHNACDDVNMVVELFEKLDIKNKLNFAI